MTSSPGSYDVYKVLFTRGLSGTMKVPTDRRATSYAGNQRGRTENDGLRAAMRDQAPLIYFYGIRPSLVQVISPVYLIGEEPTHEQFVLAVDEEQRAVVLSSQFERPSGGS